MEQLQNQNNMPVEEQEIDLVELIQKMWINRWLIIKVTGVFVVLGVLVALFSAKVYTASCDIVPDTGKSGNSKMSSLAALAGVNLGEGADVTALSPLVYQNIMNGTSFRKELMQTKIDFEKADKPVSFFDYYTSEEYNKPGVFDYIKKYTIGLPFVILNAIRGEQPEPDYSAIGNSNGPTLETLSKDEFNAMNILGQSISLTLDQKKGYVTITSNMPEAVASAQLAQATVVLLQKYITEFKIAKVQSNLDFIQGRYDEAKKNFEDIQVRRAAFRDANTNTNKYSARVEAEKLDAEYTLAMNLYSELATQLEQAKIEVKKDTPILTVVRPVTIPYERSKPARVKIVLVFTFLGVMAGAGLVLGLPMLANITGNDRIKRFVNELPEKAMEN
ncbi:MAG: lipopolysaccharide biosynthesis protein [Alistipes sp.]|nr:lipopolysaccharide biosynthesis protein [Alistipes sp.]